MVRAQPLKRLHTIKASSRQEVAVVIISDEEEVEWAAGVVEAVEGRWGRMQNG